MIVLKVKPPEYARMQQFIDEQCGIILGTGKEYLIESRLGDLAVENGSHSFADFLSKAQSDSSGRLKDQIVDAMTTNETLWFRDRSVWEYIEEIAIPQLINKVENGGKVRVWSAAASTGQEPYSLLMLLHEAVKSMGKTDLMNRIEILGTDISSTALVTAQSGRYGGMAINRGMSDDKKRNYFTQKGNEWEFDQQLKKSVTFKRFNLQNSFTSLGTFDLILCRYVAIYFSIPFKRELFSKIAKVLKPGCALLLGATESLRGSRMILKSLIIKML